MIRRDSSLIDGFRLHYGRVRGKGEQKKLSTKFYCCSSYLFHRLAQPCLDYSRVERWTPRVSIGFKTVERVDRPFNATRNHRNFGNFRLSKKHISVVDPKRFSITPIKPVLQPRLWAEVQGEAQNVEKRDWMIQEIPVSWPLSA